MSFLDLCKQRFSVRAYSAAPVSESQLDYILECARLAPSAVNLQPWRFIVVESNRVREQVQSCYKREWIAQAPLYIICVVCHDEEWVRRDGKRHGDIDIAIAAEHICMAAAEQGLGSCWVCNFDAVRLHDFFVPGTCRGGCRDNSRGTSYCRARGSGEETQGTDSHRESLVRCGSACSGCP